MCVNVSVEQPVYCQHLYICTATTHTFWLELFSCRWQLIHMTNLVETPSGSFVFIIPARIARLANRNLNELAQRNCSFFLARYSFNLKSWDIEIDSDEKWIAMESAQYKSDFPWLIWNISLWIYQMYCFSNLKKNQIECNASKSDGSRISTTENR